ncbi:hypothetical protein DFH09DRAFT_1348240 [Mycena vulgaris]|nr:hypothetical protein DFH09DRAFT_1348240 [Mycena vulgaris]
MSHHAMKPSSERKERDLRALGWTIKSLADDTELESFVEAISDVLWGPTERRHAYEDHIQSLLRSPDLQLLSRVEALLASCQSGLLSQELSKRRQITCYKALWSIAALQAPLDSLDYLQPLDFRFLGAPGNDATHYYTSTFALVAWSRFCGHASRIPELLECLTACESELENGRTPNLGPVVSFL